MEQTPAQRARNRFEERKLAEQKKYREAMEALKRDERAVTLKEHKEQTRYFVVIGKTLLALRTNSELIDECLRQAKEKGLIDERDQALLLRRGHTL